MVTITGDIIHIRVIIPTQDSKAANTERIGRWP